MTTTYGGRWSSGDGRPLEDVLERPLLDKLGGYLSALTTNGEAAKKILYGKVRRIAGDHKRARTLMRVAYLVITADHDAHERELAEFRQLCSMLGLQPDEVWQNAKIMRAF